MKKKTEPIDRTKIFPSEYAMGQFWTRCLKNAGMKIVAANNDQLNKAYTVALTNDVGWLVIAHRNIFGDVTSLTVWPPDSARLFEIRTPNDMDQLWERLKP